MQEHCDFLPRQSHQSISCSLYEPWPSSTIFWAMVAIFAMVVWITILHKHIQCVSWIIIFWRLKLPGIIYGSFMLGLIANISLLASRWILTKLGNWVYKKENFGAPPCNYQATTIYQSLHHIFLFMSKHFIDDCCIPLKFRLSFSPMMSRSMAKISLYPSNLMKSWYKHNLNALTLLINIISMS